MKLILASQSPRRRQLLERHGYPFEVCTPRESAETDAQQDLLPPQLVRKLAEAKAADVANTLLKQRDDQWVLIAADTVADLHGETLGKPSGRAHAKQMLHQLAGKQHAVHTAICLRKTDGATLTKVATTLLKMDALSEAQIERYLDTNRWQGKAGAFGYQDGWDWLHVIQGEESNVVGLPMQLLRKSLEEIGFPATPAE